MKNNDLPGMQYIELDGSNTYVTPKEQDKGPPSGFIDNSVKVYKLNPDGTKGEHIKDIPGYPEGWDEQGRFEIIAGKEKEDNDMPAPREDKAEKLAEVEVLMAEGKSLTQAAKEVGVPVGTLSYWLKDNKKQTPEPKPVQAVNQEPEEESQEPAIESVPVEEPEVKELADARVYKYTQEDDEPIPYVPVTDLDKLLAELKIEWLKTTIWLDALSAEEKLRFMQAVMNMQLPEVEVR